MYNEFNNKRKVFTMIFGDLAFGALFLFFGFFIGGLALVE